MIPTHEGFPGLRPVQSWVSPFARPHEGFPGFRPFKAGCPRLPVQSWVSPFAGPPLRGLGASDRGVAIWRASSMPSRATSPGGALCIAAGLPWILDRLEPPTPRSASIPTSRGRIRTSAHLPKTPQHRSHLNSTPADAQPRRVAIGGSLGSTRRRSWMYSLPFGCGR